MHHKTVTAHRLRTLPPGDLPHPTLRSRIPERDAANAGQGSITRTHYEDFPGSRIPRTRFREHPAGVHCVNAAQGPITNIPLDPAFPSAHFEDMGTTTETRNKDPSRGSIAKIFLDPALRGRTFEDTLRGATTETRDKEPPRESITGTSPGPPCQERTSRTPCGNPLPKRGARNHYEDPPRRFPPVPHSEDALRGHPAGIHYGNAGRGPFPMIHYKDPLRRFSRIPHAGDALGGRGPGINCGDPKTRIDDECPLQRAFPHSTRRTDAPNADAIHQSRRSHAEDCLQWPVTMIRCGDPLRRCVPRTHCEDPLQGSITRIFSDPEDPQR